jgi:N-acetyl-anhydromuramyl-L-alanine amidase AmpD
MPRFPKAHWAGPIPNESHGRIQLPILGLILHVEEGTEAGTNSWFHNPKAEASAHFGNPTKGPLDQWVDTHDEAWAEMAGNSRWVSVEHEGTGAISHNQIENDAQLFAWLHRTENCRLVITNRTSRGGLGWHGMGGAAWGGHRACPGDRIKAARPLIIARAKQILGTATELKRGDHGIDVRALQLALTLHPSGAHLHVTGRYDKATANAVAEFKSHHPSIGNRNGDTAGGKLWPALAV